MGNSFAWLKVHHVMPYYHSSVVLVCATMSTTSFHLQFRHRAACKTDRRRLPSYQTKYLPPFLNKDQLVRNVPFCLNCSHRPLLAFLLAARCDIDFSLHSTQLEEKIARLELRVLRSEALQGWTSQRTQLASSTNPKHANTSPNHPSPNLWSLCKSIYENAPLQ